MRIAAAQLVSRAGDVDHNVAAAVRALGQVDGARLLVLPELFLTGYAFPPATVTVDDARLDRLHQAACEAGVVVLAGAAVDVGDQRPYLSMLMFGSGARVQRVYDKMHLSGDETLYFQAGDHPVMLEIDGWALGLSICYDGSFAEHALAYAQAGADAYVASIAFYQGSEHRRDLYYRARALDNGFFAVVSGLVGPCGDAQFNGGAAIYDPEGRPMASATAGDEGVVVADVERDVIGRTRAAHPMLADRRAFLDVNRVAVL